MEAESKKRRTPHPQLRRSPINLSDAQAVPDFSGFLIIRLLPRVVSYDARSLDEVTEEFNLDQLATLLKRYNCQIYENVEVGRATLGLCVKATAERTV